MLVNKYSTIEDLKSAKGVSSFEITKDVALDFSVLEFILKKFPRAKITILSGYDKKQLYSAYDTLYTEEETKVLANNANLAHQKYGRTLTFDGMFSVSQAIAASRKINTIVDKIESAKINSEPLSPFEKFVYAYSYVTERVYLEVDKNQPSSLSRNLISVLNGDKIVCVGFANMLATILNRLGIPCTTECVVCYDNASKRYSNHAICVLRMIDPKYDLNGIYNSNPTADCSKTTVNYLGKISFSNALVKRDHFAFTHSKPMLMSKTLVKSAGKTQNFEDVKQYSYDMPIIMSYLFPEMTDAFSARNFFEPENNDCLGMVSNEHELYAGHEFEVKIFNEPYKDYFDTLTNSARFVSQNDFFRAANNIYLANGNNPQISKSLATKLLRNTRIVEPKIFD